MQRNHSFVSFSNNLNRQNMYSLYQRVIRYAWYNARYLKKIHVRSSCFCDHQPRIYSSYVTPVRAMCTKYTFNIKNTTIEFRNKLEKLKQRIQHGSNICPHTVKNILLHPCYEASRITKTDGIILLNSCSSMHEVSSEKRAECAWRIWDKIKLAGLIDLDLYHHLLIALRDSGAYVEAKHMLNCLLTYGISPNAETYALFLECAGENHNLDDIEIILSAMKSDKCEVDERGFNAILLATAKSSGLDIAKEYLNDASKRVDSGTYTSLLRGVAERSEADCFSRLLNEARDCGIEFSNDKRFAIAKSLMKGDLITFMPNILGPRDDWKSDLETLVNLIVRSLCLKNYPAMFELLNYMGDFVDQFTTGPDFLSPCKYIDVIITTMVRSKVPFKYVLQYCFENDAQVRLRTAAYASLRYNLFDDSLMYFEAMKSVDLPIRPHFFWPLFLRTQNNEEIFNIVNAMKRLEVELDYDTTYKYIVKRLSFTNPNAEEFLESRGIPVEISITPLVAVSIPRKLFSFAIDSCRKYKSMIDYEKLYFGLATSLVNNQDFASISEICLNDDRHLVEVFRNLLVYYKSNTPPAIIEKFLNTFRRNKTSIFRADLDNLRVYLKLHNLDDKIWLDSLVNEVNKDISPGQPHLRDMNIEQLENHVVLLKKNNYYVRQALRRLLIMHSEYGNVDRAMELKNELEENGMTFSLGMKVALLKVFCLKDNFKQAYELFTQMKSVGEHEKLKGSKFLLLANSAAKTSLDVMYEILKSRTVVDYEYNRDINCFQIISTVIQYHGTEAANEVFEFLIQNNYTAVKIKLFGPIMKEYLARGEIENATSACLKYANRYRLMPMRKALICKLAALIVEEKVKKSEPKFQLLLDKILLTSGYLYGSSSTNLVYITCLAEMGLLESLKLYLKDSFTGIDEALLWHECGKLSDLNKVGVLSNLEKVLKDTRFNMEPIYINLLKIHCREKDLKSASELLKSLEESNRIPSTEFLDMFTELQNGDENA